MRRYREVGYMWGVGREGMIGGISFEEERGVIEG